MNNELKSIIEEYKKRTMKKCRVVDVTDDTPGIPDDKIGGLPYIPVGEEYPVDSKGKPMALLMQINCKHIGLPEYPSNGILEIFAGAELKWPWEYQLRYYSEGKEFRTDLPVVDLSEFICNRGYKITLSDGIAYMPISDYRSEDLIAEITRDLTGHEIEDIYGLEELYPRDERSNNALWLLTESIKGEHVTIGGYADFTQEDIRPFEAEGMNMCLLKFDSIIDLKKFDIGDAGIISVLISEDDLKQRNFSNAVLTWDCT